MAQILQLSQAELVGAEHVRVTRERRVERVRGAGIRANGFHADSLNRRLFGEPLCTVDGNAWCRPSIEKRVLVAGASVPAGTDEQPAAGRQSTMLRFKRLDVRH